MGKPLKIRKNNIRCINVGIYDYKTYDTYLVEVIRKLISKRSAQICLKIRTYCTYKVIKRVVSYDGMKFSR